MRFWCMHVTSEDYKVSCSGGPVNTMQWIPIASGSVQLTASVLTGRKPSEKLHRFLWLPEALLANDH